MSREIKFRVWSESDKEYRTDCSVHKLFTSKTGTPSTIYNDEGDCFLFEQYTGLKDKKGKEIYEGDIVKYLKANYEVYFDKLQGWRGLRRGSHSAIPIGETVYEMTINCVDRPEVIGNIHENPELLGGEE